MPTLITHNQPHLDDLAAMWLMVRYLPEWAGADFAYIPTNTPPSEAADTVDRWHIGVGRGRFDEHKGDLNDCATTLVYKHLLQTATIADDEQLALAKLVAWVYAEDTGTLLAEPRREFSVPAILQAAYFSEQHNNDAVRTLAFSALDAVMHGLRNAVLLDRAWEARTEYTSRFGPAVAVETEAQEFAPYAYARGIPLVVVRGATTPYATIRAAADADVDLTSIRDRLAELDTAPWYFHHSKRMLICGGQKTANPQPTDLSLQRLIDLTL